MARPNLIYTRERSHWAAFAARAPDFWQLHFYPLIAFVPRTPTPEECAKLQAAQFVVLVSAQAMRAAAPYLRPGQIAVCLGPATLRAAQAFPFADFVTAPAPHNSESLLRVWQPSGARIAICGAPGGRTLLKEALSVHNEVLEIALYLRENPSRGVPPPLGATGENVLLLSSGFALAALLENTPKEILNLLQCQLCLAVISPRLATLARQANFQHVVTAMRAEEGAMLAAAASWLSSHRPLEHSHDR